MINSKKTLVNCDITKDISHDNALIEKLNCIPRSDQSNFRIKIGAVTVSQLCDLLGIGRTTAYRLIRENRLEVLKLGRRTLITARSIDALVAQSIVGRLS